MSLAKAFLVLLLGLPIGLRAEAPPAWVQGQGSDPGGYPGDRYLTGYGLSAPGGTEADQRRQAMAMAKEALASAIRTHVVAEFTSRVTQQDQHMTRFAQNLVRTRADLELEGLELRTWQDPKRNITHALAVLDKPRTLQLLEAQLQRQGQECARSFAAARAAGDPSGLIRARHLREAMEGQLLIHAVLAPGPLPAIQGPGSAEITEALRQAYARDPGLDRYVATAALDLEADLPKGIRVLMDRITFADTPFCGSLSAYLEQALAVQLTSLGQVRILDKARGLDALRADALNGDLAEALQSQAAVRGVLFDLGDQVKLDLRVTSAAGEELATAAVTLPAQLVRKAGLKLVPDNYLQARQTLELCDAQVQASRLEVKLMPDRGDGGIYRRGDKLHLFLKANLDCYVKLLYHQVDGTRVLIFPNKYHPDARIQKGRMYQIPPDDNSFDLEVQAPFGAEMVKLIASTDPIELDGSEPDGNGMSVVKEELASLLGRTRSIALKKAAAQYGEATAVVNTMEAAR